MAYSPLSERRDVTAILAALDTAACGPLPARQEHDISVQDGIPPAGFDNIDI